MGMFLGKFGIDDRKSGKGLCRKLIHSVLAVGVGVCIPSMDRGFLKILGRERGSFLVHSFV
jgi:hypothetical protein